MDFRSGIKVEKYPLVTIGLLSYNYSKYLLDALDSLLTQTYQNIELIIIDDYSTDNSSDLINKWIHQNKIHCTFIQNEINLGITRVSNIIVEKSSGKYICLFASDDIMLSDRITRQVAILEESTEDFGICYCYPHTMDETGKIFPRNWKEGDGGFLEGDILEQYVYRHFGFITPGTIVRRNVYDVIGFYDERVLIEDYNFFIRVVAKFKVIFCSYPCLIYRVKEKKSEIFKEWSKNNYERYFYDRIISNIEALKYIEPEHLRKYLKKKIGQYVKCLAVYNSALFLKTIFFLFTRGNFSYHPYVIIIKMHRMFYSYFLGKNYNIHTPFNDVD